jgi:hypothetical protein
VKVVAAVLGAIVGLFLICNLILWGAGISNIFYQEHLGVKTQNVQTHIFHGSQAWQDGQLQQAQQMWTEWNTAKDGGKTNTMVALESEARTLISVWPQEVWDRCSPELFNWLKSTMPGNMMKPVDTTTTTLFK